jgi:predicted MPP superfamily phosphohydrolase
MLAFEFGAFGPLAVRVERARIGLPRPLRLLYASDLHLGHWWTARVPQQLIASARGAAPDLVLLGGDLADNAAALPGLRATVSALGDIAPVYAVPGNHDRRVGEALVRGAVLAGGGRWLPDEPIAAPVRIDGALLPGTPRPRVLCAHEPGLFPAAVAAGYSLVLAGHLHGGQCVLATRRGRQYPAVWFCRWHGLRFVSGGAAMLVSRGVADTFPFRINCPREVILCEVS